MVDRRTQPVVADRVVALDMLRGLLALAVAVYHFFVVTHPFSGYARDLLVIAGVYAVQTFFIISGFCFFHLYADAPQTWSTWSGFHLKRFFRIAPLYYVAVGLSYLLDPPVYPGFNPMALLQNLTLSFGFFHPNHAMVPGGWSIGLEYVFYVALPLLIWLTRRPVALFGLTLASIACALPSTFGDVARAPEAQRFHLYVAISNHAFLFLLGGVIADVRRRWSVRLPPSVALLPVMLFGAAVWFTQPTFHDHLDVMVDFARAKYVALTFVAVLVVAFVRPPVGRVWKPLHLLGDWSYSVYLVHPFAWLIVHKCAPTGTTPAAELALAVVATLSIAAVTYRLIERPTNALGHRLAKARRIPRVQHVHAITDTHHADATVH